MEKMHVMPWPQLQMMGLLCSLIKTKFPKHNVFPFSKLCYYLKVMGILVNSGATKKHRVNFW